MRIFEFQFNPKAKSNRFFRVFSFHAPASPAGGPQESQDQGDMYIIGELKNALPINSGFLDQLATLLSKEYYTPEKLHQNAGHRLKNALKKGNNFLAEETKKGNVDWIGNLHLLLLLFAPAGQDYTLYFTKVGGMKLWLSRSGSLVEASKTIDEKKKDEESTKVFGNVGSGKVIPQDRIVALTQELFEFFSKENFLQQITQLKEEKQFKNMFKSKEKEMSLLSGVLVFVLIEASKVPPLATLPKIKLPALLRGRPALPSRITLPSLSIPSFVKKKLSFARLAVRRAVSISNVKKRMGILLLFASVLLVGFAIFGAEQQKKEDIQETLKREKMEEQERILNKIIDIAELKVVAEFDQSFAAENFQHMTHIDGKLYFFGASSKNISLFDSQAQTSDSILQSSLADFPEDFQLAGMEEFAGNLYFLDSRTGEIVKSSKSWLDPLSPKKPINAQGMSIDGNIWILGAENEISRYHKGRYQETLNPVISPPFRNATRIKTGAQIPSLYVLESGEQRLVVLDKSGVLVQQYRNPIFEQARDFVVSPDSQTIYLFDGVKLFRFYPSINSGFR